MRFLTGMIAILAVALIVYLGWRDDFMRLIDSPKEDSSVLQSQPDTLVDMQKDEDPYLWLEDVEGERALSWVRQQNQKTQQELEASPLFKRLQEQSLAILSDKDKLPYVSLRGDFVYNLWQDESNVRGIWRRMPVDEYLAGNDQWELILDIDKLGADEGKSWVFKGSSCLEPQYERCILRLSEGGKDAVYLREFDIASKQFREDGFRLPEAKSSVNWLDDDHLLISSALLEGDRTKSGYGRKIKLWKRGESYEAAKTLLTANEEDIFVWSIVERSKAKPQPVVLFGIGRTFYQSDYYFYSDGEAKKLSLPSKIEVSGILADRLILSLKEDGLGQRAGDLVAVNLMEAAITDAPSAELLFRPDETQSVRSVAIAGDRLLVTFLEHVKGRVMELSLVENNWKSRLIELPTTGTISIMTSDEDEARALLTYEDFLTPTSIYYVELDEAESPRKIRQAPARFQAEGLSIEQRFASSKDGTKVPYYIVFNKDLPLTGDQPTLLYGYGGFEIALTPRYSALTGKLWLEKGGVYVLANIRGGGEYGPNWHQTALKTNRQKAYDDFIAVAEDLIEKNVTSPDKLAIKGGSNGGLLMGVMLTQRPDLFKAIICQVPLLDMLRYDELLAGASWVAEYGSPKDEAMRAYLAGYSPYQNIDPTKNYPEVFFVTSTKDDRVHPGHARKMAAKMMDLGKKVYYFENIEGGHAASADFEQMAARSAMEYVYLWNQVGQSLTH